MRLDSAGLTSTSKRGGARSPREKGPERDSEKEDLRRLLRQEKQATLEALQSTGEVKRKLTEKETQLASIKRKAVIAGKGRPFLKVDPQGESHLALIKAQWQRTKKDLDQERNTRKAQEVVAATKVTSLEKKLVAASNEVGVIRASSARSRKKLLYAGAVVVLVAFSLGALVLKYYLAKVTLPRQSPQTEVSDLPLSGESSPARGEKRKPSPQKIPIAASAAYADLSPAMDRLTGALASLSGEEAENRIRELNLHNSEAVCPIDWNGGEPFLVFGSAKPAQRVRSLRETLTRCSAAIETAKSSRN